MSAGLIHALLSPTCYPHPAAGIRLLETHISWVLLTGTFAYKIKKPVNFGFLDFSTLAKRKHYCEEELRLNARFSSGLYLAVVPITGSETEPQIDGHGAVVDYAVKMRQFDQEQLLDSLAQEQALGVDDMQHIARQLAGFHQQQAARLPADERELGTAASIAAAALENFRQIAQRLNSASDRADLDYLRQWTERQLASLQSVFGERRAQGFVRECHGDLHLRNIARINGAITFFDCIEFSAPLRWIDVQSELAFLLMDMEDRHLQALSNRLLNFYLEYTGDYAGLAVLRFYKVYRALVRAKVLVLKLDGENLTAEAQQTIWRNYAAYVRLAQGYCAPQPPFLGLMHGISGTGKSTVAATLAAEFDAIRIRSDVERKRLFGLAPDARTAGEESRRLYREAASVRTFAALEALAEKLLALGYPVLVDATFIAAKWRRRFLDLAHNLQQPVVILDCQASEETILRRLAQREATQHDASEAGVEVMRAQREQQDAFSAGESPYVLAIDTELPLTSTALQHYLERYPPAPARNPLA